MSEVKGKLDRDRLKENGITLGRNVVDLSNLRELLGDQAENLAGRLLNFHQFAPQERAQALLSSTDRNLSNRLKADLESAQEVENLKKLKAKGVRSHREAMNIVVASEDRWMDLVKEELFKDVRQRARDAEGAKALSVNQLARALRVDRDVTWYAAYQARSETALPDAPKLTRPKPDLYISLPTVDQQKVPRGFARIPSLRSFLTVDLLSLQREIGLVSNPLGFASGGKIKDKDRHCFPCMVLEAKHHEVKQSEVMKCYYQAANATSSALAMLDSLTRDFIQSNFKSEGRPVVAITLNGHQTRVWVAGIKYKVNISKRVPLGGGLKWRKFTKVRYHMQCIWKGDLHDEEPMMQLICIIDNLEKWINDDFRPWVSRHLSRHYYNEGIWEDIDEETSMCNNEEEEDSSGVEDSDSENSEDYEDQTDEEERQWDENWVLDTEEESESGLSSDDEDYDEYLRDKERADSLMDQASFLPAFSPGR